MDPLQSVNSVSQVTQVQRREQTNTNQAPPPPPPPPQDAAYYEPEISDTSKLFNALESQGYVSSQDMNQFRNDMQQSVQLGNFDAKEMAQSAPDPIQDLASQQNIDLEKAMDDFASQYTKATYSEADAAMTPMPVQSEETIEEIPSENTTDAALAEEIPVEKTNHEIYTDELKATKMKEDRQKEALINKEIADKQRVESERDNAAERTEILQEIAAKDSNPINDETTATEVEPKNEPGPVEMANMRAAEEIPVSEEPRAEKESKEPGPVEKAMEANMEENNEDE